MDDLFRDREPGDDDDADEHDDELMTIGVILRHIELDDRENRIRHGEVARQLESKIARAVDSMRADIRRSATTGRPTGNAVRCDVLIRGVIEQAHGVVTEWREPCNGELRGTWHRRLARQCRNNKCRLCMGSNR